VVYLVHFSHLSFLLVILLFKMVSKCSAEALPRVPKHKMVVMCLMEKIYVSHKHHSDVSYTAVGHEFNITESIIYIQNNKIRCL